MVAFLSGCKVESVFLNIEAVNTHRDKPEVLGPSTGRRFSAAIRASRQLSSLLSSERGRGQGPRRGPGDGPGPHLGDAAVAGGLTDAPPRGSVGERTL